ncbi:PRD domain-containing protein [Peribacillus sp. FSL R5-0717]|uniref:PRD domain-containing protein n=1 Tax=Peribacillus sp. FSL R5-0717 TaxID=2975308 RepID=UPI0030F4BE33
MYEGLYRHITGLLSRVKNDLQVFNPLKDTIKESYAEIYQAVTCFSKQIEDYIKKNYQKMRSGF